jgi:hypothetical protein
MMVVEREKVLALLKQTSERARVVVPLSGAHSN